MKGKFVGHYILHRSQLWTGIYGDATEGTYRHGKPTGMMARDRTPGLSRFEPLLESLQDRESLVR
jgi:hypothetical protein